MSIKFPFAAWMLKKNNKFPDFKDSLFLPYRATTTTKKWGLQQDRIRAFHKAMQGDGCRQWIWEVRKEVQIVTYLLCSSCTLTAREDQMYLWDFFCLICQNELAWFWVLGTLTRVGGGGRGHLRQQKVLGWPWAGESLGPSPTLKESFWFLPLFLAAFPFRKGAEQEESDRVEE